jgi:hypothetical protein
MTFITNGGFTNTTGMNRWMFLAMEMNRWMFLAMEWTTKWTMEWTTTWITTWTTKWATKWMCWWRMDKLIMRNFDQLCKGSWSDINNGHCINRYKHGKELMNLQLGNHHLSTTQSSDVDEADQMEPEIVGNTIPAAPEGIRPVSNWRNEHQDYAVDAGNLDTTSGAVPTPHSLNR